MKLLGYICGFLWIGGFAASALLFLYIEWVIRLSKLFAAVQPVPASPIVFTLLTLPLFWGLLVVTGIAGRCLSSRQGAGSRGAVTTESSLCPVHRTVAGGGNDGCSRNR